MKGGRQTLEVGKTGFDLNDIIGAEFDHIVVLGLEIGTGEAPLGFDVGWPSLRDRGRTVEIQGGKSLDAFLVRLVRRDPFDVRTDDGLGGPRCDQGGGRDVGERTGHGARLVAVYSK